MKLIEPSYKIIEQKPGLEGIYEQIEMAGRTCYKSQRPEGKTAKDFVDKLIASKHFAVLEHGTVYLSIPINEYSTDIYLDSVLLITLFDEAPYTEIHYAVEYDPEENNDIAYITTNLRVLYEYFSEIDREFILNKYLSEPTRYHAKRITVKFTSNLHFYKDITRHRLFSYCIESTRYCNYSKDKYGNELTFISPEWLKDDRASKLFKKNLMAAEDTYLDLIQEGWKAQQAAEVLPQAIKADMIMTGFTSDWQHVFNLRTSHIAATGKPHPEISRLMDPLYKEFVDKNYIKL